jgi:hypothetical protein
LDGKAEQPLGAMQMRLVWIASLPRENATSPVTNKHLYEVRPRADKRGINLISDVLPFCRLWYGEPDAISNAIGYAKFRRRSHEAVIRVYDAAGNVIDTHEQAGEFKRAVSHFFLAPWSGPLVNVADMLVTTVMKAASKFPWKEVVVYTPEALKHLGVIIKEINKRLRSAGGGNKSSGVSLEERVTKVEAALSESLEALQTTSEQLAKNVQEIATAGTRETFTIAAVAFVCSAAASNTSPVTFESPCECRDNHGKHRSSVKNDPSLPPSDANAIQADTTSDFETLALVI